VEWGENGAGADLVEHRIAGRIRHLSILDNARFVTCTDLARGSIVTMNSLGPVGKISRLRSLIKRVSQGLVFARTRLPEVARPL